MALTPGTQIGSYEIITPLGAGGMGEVYRAHDRKLGRDVAIKVLPDALRADAEQLARFEREARLLAALNHVNIATIHGVEEAPGLNALVMELVEGDTLAQLLGTDGPGTEARGQRAEGRAQRSEGRDQRAEGGGQRAEGGGQRGRGLPIADALGIARQIADGLDAAHEKGIVHRDLKPANIKITPTGVVKVLDFGLAKGEGIFGAGGAGETDPSESPTMTSDGTRLGVILGTAAYMSPEQARGLPVDKRADVWAFGCVLYEMLTGRPPFPGATISDILVSVLEREPDWTALPPAIPPGTRRVLHRCLEKDPRRRLRDIGDARLDLDELPAAVSDVGSPGAIASRREIAFQRLTEFPGMKEAPAVSPDGKMVAFVALIGRRRQIFVSLLAGGAQLQLTRDNVDHEQPRWTPDSSSLVYYTPPVKADDQGTLWEISALGGWPRRIVSAMGGADVSHDGRRLALFQRAGDQLALVTSARDGSHVERVALLPAGFTYSRPRWSPDDRELALERANNSAFDIVLEVVPVTGGERELVTRGVLIQGYCWLRDGSGFVYSGSRGSTMYYPPVLNLRTVGRHGESDSPLTFGDTSYADPDVDRSGKLLATRIRSRSDVWKLPVSGAPADNVASAVRITQQTGHVRTPSVSPDESEVVYISDTGGHGNLWVTSTTQADARQITFEADPTVVIGVPKWSPRGDLIAFTVTHQGRAAIGAVRPDGSGLCEMVAKGWAPGWSGDGEWLYYQSFSAEHSRIEKVPADGGEPIIVRNEPDASLPAVSADNLALVYVVTTGSHTLGLWRRSVQVELRRARPEDGPGEPIARLASERIPGTPPIATFALSPDGQKIAASLIDGATANLWEIAVAGGAMRQLTDFGDRQTMISRSVAWSPDGRHLYAAVEESERDIVLIDGLLSSK